MLHEGVENKAAAIIVEEIDDASISLAIAESAKRAALDQLLIARAGVDAVRRRLNHAGNPTGVLAVTRAQTKLGTANEAFENARARVAQARLRLNAAHSQRHAS